MLRGVALDLTHTLVQGHLAGGDCAGRGTGAIELAEAPRWGRLCWAVANLLETTFPKADVGPYVEGWAIGARDIGRSEIVLMTRHDPHASLMTRHTSDECILVR